MTISQFYNHIFYITLIGLNWLSNNLIVNPLLWIIKLLPLPEKSVKIITKQLLIRQNNPDKNRNTSWAYRWMLWSLTWIIIFALAPLSVYFELQLFTSLIVAAIVSISLNETILWRKDKYKTYFKTFNKEQIPSTLRRITIAFHLIPFICIGLLIKLNN